VRDLYNETAFLEKASLGKSALSEMSKIKIGLKEAGNSLQPIKPPLFSKKTGLQDGGKPDSDKNSERNEK
jgi:hypothetical protein